MNANIQDRRYGFTLVEVLVVVAILILLAALVVVGAGKAKQTALEAKALGPLRDVATANAAFAMEHNGQINTLKWKGDPEEGQPFVGNSFWGRLDPYLFPDLAANSQNLLKKDILNRLESVLATKDPKTMAGTVVQGSRIYHDASGLPIPFAFNDSLYTWNHWENMNRVSGPTEILYITYGFGVFDEKDGRSYVERPTDGSKPENNIYYLNSKKAMVAFLDGHVEKLATPIPERLYHDLEG